MCQKGRKGKEGRERREKKRREDRREMIEFYGYIHTGFISHIVKGTYSSHVTGSGVRFCFVVGV